MPICCAAPKRLVKLVTRFFRSIRKIRGLFFSNIWHTPRNQKRTTWFPPETNEYHPQHFQLAPPARPALEMPVNERLPPGLKDGKSRGESQTIGRAQCIEPD
jgi:hypothetical protein